MIIISSIINLILFAVFNGLIIQWFNNKNKDKVTIYSNYWHIIGWFIRLLLIITIGIINYKFIIVAIFIAWTGYNKIINFILDKPIDYIGITFLDKYISSKVQLLIDIVLFLLAIISITI